MGNYDGEEKRGGIDRRSYCPMHVEQVKQTSTLSGMVKVLLILVSGFALSMMIVSGTMLWVGMGIDKTFSNYISSHTVEAQQWILQIKKNAETDVSLGEDIDIIKDRQKEQGYLLQRIEKQVKGHGAP